MYHPKYFSGSVEHKVAKAMADKEGLALKRQQAIEEEAERKRLKKEIADRVKQQTLTQKKVATTNSKAAIKVPRIVEMRSVGCQVRPKDVPGFQTLAYVGTESQYTGVHFKEDYAVVRSQVRVPVIVPHLTPSPNQSNFPLSIMEQRIRRIGMAPAKARLNGTAEPLPAPPARTKCKKTQSIVLVEEEEEEEEEEKYVGPLLHGTAPEMIVSSGALGMTDTRQKQQINYQQQRSTGRKRGAEDADREALMGQPKGFKSGLFQPGGSPQVLNSSTYSDNFDYPPFGYDDSSAPSSSTNFQSSSSDPINQSIMSCIGKSMKPSRKREEGVAEQMEYPQYPFLCEESFEINYGMASGAEILETSEEDRIRLEEHEKALARFREIGRRVCEMDIMDFASEKSKNDRKTFMIASRGEEILATVRKNLSVIRDKLGDYAKGTIFDHVDELTNSFADVSPNAITRLNLIVAEKLKQNAEATIARTAVRSESPMSSESKEVKLEELDVKLEPPEYTEEHGN